MKNLETLSSIFIFVFSSSAGELCSRPISRIGRKFPEHVERSFLDPEYSFDEYFQLGSQRNIRPIKNGLKASAKLKGFVSHPTTDTNKSRNGDSHSDPVLNLIAQTADFFKPVLNWTNVCSPNILRTVLRTMIRFIIELLVWQTWFGQFDELYFVLSWLVMRCKLRPELVADAQQTA